MFWKLQEIKIQPDVIFTPFGFPVTNTLLCTWICILIIAFITFIGTRRRDLIPAGVQNFVEWAVEGMLNLVEGVVGKEKGRKFFPLVATFFFFILIANLTDILPGIDTIGWVNLDAVRAAHLPDPTSIFLFGDYTNKIVPWFRPPTSDLNLTFAMALVSVVVTQIFGFAWLGPGLHLGKYFKFKELFTHGVQGPIEFFVGIVELITEISRLLSFAFRLFGNIFAGSAVLALFAFLVPAFGDVIFIPLEIFVALVQALVFALLTLVFLEMATSSHEHPESEHEAEQEYEQAKEHDQMVAASR
ncbi:MAG TPA: F0F1 ATP synthase subunit A [Ktedonobacteraceae bacterium]|nr:F0F1 ATP synthase subunit A [Ktedonobacteraceae bacterium]